MTVILAVGFAVLAILSGLLANEWCRTSKGVLLGIVTVSSIVMAGVFTVCSLI
jgi:hypothetical protein